MTSNADSGSGVGTIILQADAVRGDLSRQQSVTFGYAPDDDDGTESPFHVDLSTGELVYAATGEPVPPRALARDPRASLVARQALGLVLRRISARESERPLVRLEIGSRDVRIHRPLTPTLAKSRLGGGKRRKISRFSEASARRLLFTVRNLTGLRNMLTLTYPAEFPLDGRVAKQHMRRMRQWLTRHGNPTGIWWLEFQERGAPHFHVLLPNAIGRVAVAEAWYRIVGSGDERHLWAGTRIEALRKPEAAGAYAAGYAKKQAQKEVPEEYSDVGRFWGVWGKPDIARTVVFRGSEAAALVRTVRRGYQAKRRDWKSPRHFRDNGRSGFTAWETAQITERLIGILTAKARREILAIEHSRQLREGPYKSGGRASPIHRGDAKSEAQGSRENVVALSAHAHSIDQVRPWPDRLE